MSEIEIEFLELQKNSNCIFLLGDFNSRTANEQDFFNTSDFEEHLTEFIDVNEFNDIHVLDDLKIPRIRNSSDTVVNSYGRKLIQFCKNNNMYILNGRVGKDRVLGKPTSRSISVVDYILCTANILCKVDDFKVSDFCNLFSDIHAPLCLSLTVNGCNATQGESEVITDKNVHIGKWKHEKTIEYKNNIDVDKVNELLLNVMSKYDDISSVDQATVDSIVSDITTVLLSAAKDTFGVFTKNSKNIGGEGNFSNKDWFNKDCKKVRQEFRKSRRLYKHYGSNLFKERLRQSEKHYKKVMDENIKKYNENLRTKMRNMRFKNPREFWKIWNKVKHKNNCNITTESLFTFFKDINKNKYEGDTYDINNDVGQESSNSMLNESITAEEILKAIKHIKNNKSSGDDMIVNEYISSSIDCMIDIYVYIFNIIFDSGILPEAWIIGNVIPVFKNKGRYRRGIRM
ncbi:DNA-directed RNA polymerase subunit beta-like [Mytilus edulis]|uniref:DNA-directed RNA polymerase subunit beta-like n=1 Tax=Mytilus edulis TaxID=6550 RepID=UPI0039EE8130